MRPRVVLAVVGAAALIGAAAVVVRVASAGKRPEFTATYTQAAVWNGGLMGTFTVRNPSGRAASDWRISFSLPPDVKLAGVWNGEVSPSGSGYVITPIAQTRTIGPHRSVRIGFTAVASRPTAPRTCTVNGRTCTVAVAMSALAPAPAGGHLGAAPSDTSDGLSDGGLSDGGRSDGSALASGASGRPASDSIGHATGGQAVATSPATSFAPAVNVTNASRPTLRIIAAASGARVLTLVSALPAVGGRCDLKWGGVVEPAAYRKEISDAANSGVALIASIGAANGADLARACGSEAALEAQVKKVLDLGVRSVDFTIASGSLTDKAVNARLGRVVGRLKAQYAGLTVAYTLPAVAPDGLLANPRSVTAPLVAAEAAGAVIDRINVAPVDVAAPLDALGPQLGGLATAVDPLLTAAIAVHDQVMSVERVDAASAWRMLGLIPVIGTDELAEGAPQLAAAIGRLAAFAKSTGLGLLGLLPLNTGQACVANLVNQLLALPPIPLLGCVDSRTLPGFFTITDDFNRALR